MQDPLTQFDWFDEVETVEPTDPRHLAARVLFGLIRVLRECRSQVNHLFAAEEGSRGSLEVVAFLKGLVRTGVLRLGEATTHMVEDAMFFIDNNYDGLVNLRALSRAVAAAQAFSRRRTRQQTGLDCKKSVSASQMYHESLPIESVKVEGSERRLFHFKSAWQKFMQQQHDLLVLHGSER